MSFQIDEDTIKKLKEGFQDHIGDIEKEALGDVWVPEEYKYEKTKKQFQKDIYKEWEKQAKRTRDPVERLRKELHDELDEIKDAIRKIGILLDSDAPTEEQLEKYKMLKDAYLKYKMIEALVLGKEKD